MRNRLRLALAVFALVAAGVVTVAHANLTSSTQIGDDRVTTAPASDTFDYAGAALTYYGQVETFAAAVRDHEAEIAAAAVKAEADRKAAAAAAEKKKSQAPANSVSRPAPVYSDGGTVWDRLAQCESGGNWSHPPVTNTPGNPGSYSGGLMFSHTYWRGPTTYPYQATREQQIEVAERILASQGWGAWPSCSSRLGLR